MLIILIKSSLSPSHSTIKTKLLRQLLLLFCSISMSTSSIKKRLGGFGIVVTMSEKSGSKR